jgi:hypothetical protein
MTENSVVLLTAAPKTAVAEIASGDVTVAPIDRVYRKALKAAEIPATGAGGRHRVADEARRLHAGEFPQETTDRFFASYRGLVAAHLKRSRASGTPLVLHGQTLAFPAEAALVGKLVRRVFGGDVELPRVLTVPAARVKGVVDHPADVTAAARVANDLVGRSAS